MRRVFVYEHVTGGGLAGQALPAQLAREGAAMLEAVATDLRALGLELLTMRDPRCAAAGFPADVAVVHQPEAFDELFEAHARAADAALVIAPETDGQLLRLTRRLARHRCRNLGSDAAAVALCTDKLHLARHWQACGIPTPTTALRPDGLAPPLVAKPRDGAGCQQTRRIDDTQDLAVLPAEPNRVYQPWVDGQPASVSFLIQRQTIHALPAGEQFMARNADLRYRGGRVPLTGPLGQRATDLARRAVASVPGLHGFVGVDLVIGRTAADDRAIEINPRVTMSYLGLRRLCRSNLAAVMVGRETAAPNWPTAAPAVTWQDETVNVHDSEKGPKETA